MTEIASDLFDASRVAGNLEWEVYERTCAILVDVVVNDTGHDEYDHSLEVYVDGTTPPDWVCTAAQRDALLLMGFSRFWINFEDCTQQHCTAAHLGVRRPSSHLRKRDKRAAPTEVGEPKAWMSDDGFFSVSPGGGYDIPLYALPSPLEARTQEKPR